MVQINYYSNFIDSVLCQRQYSFPHDLLYVLLNHHPPPPIASLTHYCTCLLLAAVENRVLSPELGCLGVGTVTVWLVE
jgi:hypothetical protein